MSESNNSEDSCKELPAVDIKVTGKPQPLATYSYPVGIPDEDINDKVVPIRGKDLKRWRSKLLKISKSPIPWDNLLLAMSMLLLGSYFTVLLTGQAYDGIINFLMHTVLPCLGVGFLVGYFFVRRIAISSPKDLSTDLLSEIPNPDKMTISGEINEPE